MRVLHLIDLRAGRERGVEPIIACRAAASMANIEHFVIGVGAGRDVASAAALGLTVHEVIGPVGGAAVLAARRLRRVIGARGGFTAEVVQCWSVGMLALARLAFGGRSPVRVGALIRASGGGSISASRDLMHRGALHGATLFCFDRSVRSAWAGAASLLRGGAFGEQDIRLLAAPTSNIALNLAERAESRARLGLRNGEMAVGLLADPPGGAGAGGADAQRFAFMLGLLYTTGSRVVGVVPRGVVNEARAKRFVRMHGRGWGFVSTSLPLPEMLGACDVGVWDGGDPNRGGGGSSGSVTLALAASMGLPIVAARHEVSIAALGGLAPDLIARDATLNAVADRLLTLVDDAATRERVGTMLRLAALRQGEGAFEHDLARLWREAANVPELREGLPRPLALAGSAA